MEYNYLNKDFSDYSKTILELVKAYYPNTYSDFSDESVGKMIFDLIAMTGDTLSFFSDVQMSEMNALYATEKKNLFAIAYTHGYQPKVSYPSTVELDVYQLVPSKIISGSYHPDYDYCVLIKENTVVSSLTNGQNFLIQDNIDFSINNVNEPRVERVATVDNSGNPTYYLLSKKATAISGQIKTIDFTIGTAQKYLNLEIVDDSIIQVIDVVDSDDNKWYEVSNLAQDVVFSDFKDNSGYYHLELKKVSRRFVTRFLSENTLQLEFGSGINTAVDEEIIINPDNVGINTYSNISKMESSYDITDFTKTNTYGTAPRNTILTVRYLVGGGVESNVEANTITSISTVDVVQNQTLDTNQLQYVRDSLATNNSNPATGGKDGDSIDELRVKILGAYASQNRLVSEDDYQIRLMSLPAKYGAISKVLNKSDNGVINLYCLGYTNNKHLSLLSDIQKKNIKTYLTRYRGSEPIQIKDSFIINFKVDYEISVLPTYNSNEVLLNCNNSLKSFFDISKWQINQPIYISDIYNILSQIKGVQNIMSVKLTNLSGGQYSEISYDFQGALKNNIIYPPVDISIFEIKFPDTDIRGRVVSF